MSNMKFEYYLNKLCGKQSEVVERSSKERVREEAQQYEYE
jgi:hypothetical protein